MKLICFHHPSTLDSCLHRPLSAKRLLHQKRDDARLQWCRGQWFSGAFLVTGNLSQQGEKNMESQGKNMEIIPENTAEKKTDQCGNIPSHSPEKGRMVGASNKSVPEMDTE